VHHTDMQLVYMKPEDIANYLPCGIYGNVSRSICVILLGQTTPRARILLVKHMWNIKPYVINLFAHVKSLPRVNNKFKLIKL
jgi:hypothetical protein